MKITKKTTGFPLFMAVWNKAQGQGTPAVHMRIARWLEKRRLDGDLRLLLMAFRSCGKSTIVGLYAAWLLWRQPALRILVLAADGSLAAKMVRNTKRIIERHPLTTGMRPDKPDQWAADRFTVKRRAEWRDPSMIAFGIGANITGSRADVIICDDVEVPNTCDTPDKRENLRDRLAELSFVLVPSGTQIYVGTPHSYETLYESELVQDYHALRVPLLKADGSSVWPERFSADDIESLKKSGGPRRFAAQMMLRAQPATDSRLSVEVLQWYEGDLAYSEAQGKPQLHIDGRRMVSCSAWWDPAFGHGGDGSVLAIVFADADGGYYLHHLAYLRTDPRSSDDEATQQCRMVASLCRGFFVTAVSVEINGIGRFLPAILRREMANAAAVVEMSSHRNKEMRILEAFDAVLAARALHVHAGVRKTPFVEEMREWVPNGKCRDDGLDAVAGALAQTPVRIGSRAPAPARPKSWHAGAGSHKARSDFNV